MKSEWKHFDKAFVKMDEAFQHIDAGFRSKDWTAQSGWQCPKCGRVWSPTMPACSPCNVPPKKGDSQ